MISIADKLKQLAKDEKSFSEIVALINSITPINRDENAVSSFFSEGDFLFWSVSADKSKSDLFFSDSLKKITGFYPEEIINRPGQLISLIHPDDVPDVKKKITEFEETPDVFSLNLSYRIINRNNENVWLDGVINVTRDAKGNIIKYFNLFKNVSQLHLVIKNLLVENNVLREKNHAKDRFISIVSHDLRAPFTSLLGFSEILLNEQFLPDSEKKEYLGYIHEASQNQLQLINYLLDWSRLQTGKLTVEPRRLNAKMLISGSAAQLAGAAIKKNIDLQISCQDDIFINADERLLCQSINNLLSNALKFTKQNKNVYLSCNRFKKGFIEFVIKDEGTGISEENQAKLFKIDEKVSLTGTDGEKGTGLGLMLVKEIISKHGGEIWFYSETDKGSEFHFTVPESKNSILIVEDNADICELYAELVSEAMPGYEIIKTQNGYEAICIVLKDTPTLVISDHEMPLMNGIQLVEAMYKNEENRHIPIIIISAKITPKLHEEYIGFGVKHILPKPVDTDLLLSLIKSSVNLNGR
ncbi:MAG: response regulator [Ignavibacteria bacterium]|nr:response regulator [Ignavibacteria bacterium]